jgi:hypothetical protein
VDIEQKAKRSKSLLENEHFVATMEDLRNDQMVVFANSAAEEIERREEAHAILRALNAIERSLRSDVDAMKLITKERHRGND